MPLKDTWERLISFIKENRIVFVDMDNPNYDKCLIKLQPLIEATKELLKDTHGCRGVPPEEIDNLAETLLPAMLEFLQSEEGKREFAAWLESREKTKIEKESIEGKAS